ncbi:hypothetical protein RRG08_053260 [Elysia crispata]|uniref:Uncharacterized protein n=1 Tax=Elysia crispata TaxID=231223 RepID=A0AAE1E1W8_9GAST|nr:hypothetical protein RRG08_053260 [Elysia crispata]
MQQVRKRTDGSVRQLHCNPIYLGQTVVSVPRPLPVTPETLESPPQWEDTSTRPGLAPVEQLVAAVRAFVQRVLLGHELWQASEGREGGNHHSGPAVSGSEPVITISSFIRITLGDFVVVVDGVNQRDHSPRLVWEESDPELE